MIKLMFFCLKSASFMEKSAKKSVSLYRVLIYSRTNKANMAAACRSINEALHKILIRWQFQYQSHPSYQINVSSLSYYNNIPIINAPTMTLCNPEWPVLYLYQPITCSNANLYKIYLLKFLNSLPLLLCS